MMKNQTSRFLGLAEVDLNCRQRAKIFPPLFVKGTIKGEITAQLRGVDSCEKALLSSPYL